MCLKKVLLIFPPNWSACVSGPHLALPLIAGSCRNFDWRIEIWDLSQDFYNLNLDTSQNVNIVDAVFSQNFEVLDEIYFNWEDQFRSLHKKKADFGLISGYSFSEYYQSSLADIIIKLKDETIFTPYFLNTILPRLERYEPTVVGMTVASQNQLVPAIELLLLIRKVFPKILLILGGNVITRLRNSPVLEILKEIVDQIVLFQGDLVFPQILKKVELSSIEDVRTKLQKIVSFETIPYQSWPTPKFDGIKLDHYIGIPVLPYVSTRGCYWGKCDFCAISASWSSKGYYNSAPPELIIDQIVKIISEAKIPRIKFVDDSFPPYKALSFSNLLKKINVLIEWECYARLEPVWENINLLEQAYNSGLRKIYFGLELAPNSNRNLLGKNDFADPLKIMRNCKKIGIKVHIFCMVGYPGTNVEDARKTVTFLLENESLIETADLVGFRYERGTKVPGIKPILNTNSDWLMNLPYIPLNKDILSQEEVNELEIMCQEILWENVPRFLHPLYRVVGPWKTELTYKSKINYKFEYF